MYWFDEPKGERGIDLVQLHDDLERNQMWNDADDWTPSSWAYSSDRDLRDINPEMGVNTSGSPKGAPPPEEDIYLGISFNPAEMLDLCTSEKGKGSHYIAGNDPFRYATDNDLNVLEFSVIKYVTRHRRKNGKKDLEKARHVLDRLFEEYYGG